MKSLPGLMYSVACKEVCMRIAQHDVQLLDQRVCFTSCYSKSLQLDRATPLNVNYKQKTNKNN